MANDIEDDINFDDDKGWKETQKGLETRMPGGKERAREVDEVRGSRAYTRG